MKKKVPANIERYRITRGPLASDASAGMNGMFRVQYADTELAIIISDGMGWDMAWVKNLFFEPEETVVQFHPKQSCYVNACENCLHLWRKQGQEYELPPTFMLA